MSRGVQKGARKQEQEQSGVLTNIAALVGGPVTEKMLAGWLQRRPWDTEGQG
jgi:hypothetical protein